MNKDFTKEDFQRFWGKEGYYDKITFGVGFEKICQVCLYPFFDVNKVCLEIGSGRGVFTEKLIGNFKKVIAIDVIEQPENLKRLGIKYIELENQDYKCTGIRNGSIDFCFSHGVFCHLSNEALKEYFINIHRVLKKGADCVFMISNYENMSKVIPDKVIPERGELTASLHFRQDKDTIYEVLNLKQFKIVSDNMIPEHRDLFIHIRKWE